MQALDYHCSLGRGPHLAQLGPFAFIDVPSGWEEQEPGSTTLSNPVEAGMVAAIVKTLRQAHGRLPAAGPGELHGRRQQLSIGVISPYAGQVEAINAKLGLSPAATQQGPAGGSRGGAALPSPHGGNAAAGADEGGGCHVEVRSVDGFQGREMDVILISCVRNNSKGAIGFLCDAR